MFSSPWMMGLALLVAGVVIVVAWMGITKHIREHSGPSGGPEDLCE